ncbi:MULTISPECIES: ornithine cyclodeaminase family protein [unclassified Streptomyces]|uniref:ornithine cyclodeaminase family protein n=1 Tax=unclassified Streptomyces TaxID=2593676 RepID=UPI000DC4B051|nr:ornithine cyclodeaminase family protein [Streptomyces sp. PsTaAH-137]RAJ85103.1 ornithine cyclodeaminase/alanine dehydrogenase [Streptomyces sp. PsTaAH-137]
MSGLLILNRSEVRATLDMAQVVEAVEEAHAALSSGTAVQPPRSVAEVPGTSTMLVPMLAAVGPHGAAGVKLLADTPDNRARSLPTQQSLILLVDPVTGAPEALLDGAAVTQFRTAAASAVATRHLARPGGSPQTLGLVGAGNQARTHLAAIRHVREIDRVVVWSRSAETVEAFREHAREHAAGVEVVVGSSPEEVVRGADIVCTLTPSHTPLVEGRWFRPGQHINAVGAPPRPDHREIDTEGIARSRVVVDSYDTALAESGDMLLPVAEGAITTDHFRTELGAVINGSTPGRRHEDDITLYNSVGVGIQDMSTARLVVDIARSKNLGTELRMS